MAGYPQNPLGNRPTPAGWTGAVADTASPAGGNGPGASTPYPRQDPDEGSWFWGAVHGAEHFAESAYHAASGLVQDAEETAMRVAHVAQAIYLAGDYADDAIRDKIRIEVHELKKAFIPGLVMSLGVLAITTLAGATVAGILVGALTAGAGAIPAAVAGGELGLDAGFLILDAMGIGFLLRTVFDGISQVFTMVKTAMEIAWNAGSDPKRPPMADIQTAAHGLAAATAETVSLLLQGALIWILSESAVARAGKLAQNTGKLSSPAALATRGSQVLNDLRARPAEMRATLREGVAELAAILRKAGQLTGGLADFIETRFEQIVKNVTEDAGKQAQDLKRSGGGGGGETDGSVGVGDRSGARKSTTSTSYNPKPAATPAPVTPVRTRLPQDVNVNPSPPRVLGLKRPIGTSPRQASELSSDIQKAQAQGATDIRVNQQQVDANGMRVGTNRPDLQYTDANGQRHYIEYDSPASGRGPAHADRLLANDPDGVVTLKTVPESNAPVQATTVTGP